MRLKNVLKRTCDDGKIYNNDYIDYDFKVSDHRHITGKYRGSAHRDSIINVKLNHKIPVVSHNLKIMIHILLYKN